MAIKLILKRKPKRKAGTRAGLTKAIIASAAADQMEASTDSFSLRRLAKSLGVVSTSIRAHFPGGVSEIFDAVVSAALKDVARPFKPKEEPKEYLSDLMFAILITLHGRPVIAILTVQHLSINPVLAPALAERLLASIFALGAPKEAAPKIFIRALGQICEMIVTESTRSKMASQQAVAARLGSSIAALPKAEFSHLADMREALMAEIAKGGVEPPSPEVAHYYANRLMAVVSEP